MINGQEKDSHNTPFASGMESAKAFESKPKIDLLTVKLDFNITFQRALIRYNHTVKEALTSLPPNWEVAKVAQDTFRDILFAFLLNKVMNINITSEEMKVIQNALSDYNSQKNNPSTQVSP